ncbi:MAG: hypothetical protein JRH16_23980, partial [Deltaproteobacteria bacterium]|nr:hypothetical protein [Deltaproteobacteria bacterium]
MRDAIEKFGRPEEFGHGSGWDATLFAIAAIVAPFLLRHRLEHRLEKHVQLWCRADHHRDVVPQRRADLVYEGGVGHPDPVRPARRTRERALHGRHQRIPDGAIRVLGAHHLMAHHEIVAHVHPDHEPGSVGLVSIR